MRYDTETALHEVLVRGAHIRTREARRRTQVLSGLVSGLCVLLLVVCEAVVPSVPTDVDPASYGAYLLPGMAGGYVLVGVIAFVGGAAITVACMRHRDKLQGSGRQAERGASPGSAEEDDHV